MMTFGEQIRRMRKARDMSQRALATSLGCSTVYVCEVERGSRPPFKIERVRALGKVFKLDEQTLFRLLEAAAVERVFEDDADILHARARATALEDALGWVKESASIADAVTAIEGELEEVFRS